MNLSDPATVIVFPENAPVEGQRIVPKTACGDTAKILLPFDRGILRKDNYGGRIGEIHRLPCMQNAK